MSERKVLNKYFPPDFDPAKIPRRKIAKDAQQVVRLMAPFTMCCNTCGEFIYKGKKFNAKKETALGENYYGIKIFRFYIKCTRCSAEITFKTDPKNADYICEHGAQRNYEPTTEKATHMPNAADDDSQAGDSDTEDPMKMLEESQAASKRQMEDEDMLADLRQRNARIERNDHDPNSILSSAHQASTSAATTAANLAQLKEQEEDEELVKKYFYKVQAPLGTGGPVAEAKAKGKGKGKGKEEAGLSGLGGGYGSSDEEDEEDGDVDDKQEGGEDSSIAHPSQASTITVKRKALPSGSGPTAIGAGEYQPSVAEILASKGISLFSSSSTTPVVNNAATTTTKKTGVSTASMSVSGVKRKDLASKLGIKVGKKVKV